MANVFDKTKNKFDEEENNVIALPNSDFDYEGFEIDDKIKFSLIEKEKEIKKAIKQGMRIAVELYKNLYEAQNELANSRTGTFYAWFENLGLKKDYVYRAIGKYELYLKTKNLKVLDLPKRAIEYIKKNQEDIEDVEEIINSENPTEKIKEIQQENEDLVIDDIKIKEKKLEERIEKTEKLLEKLKNQLLELKSIG